MTNEAILSSNGNYTLFSFNGYVIRFRTSSKLERYTKILEWENGYIAVTAKYKGLPEEEEYIDLVPILENLYIDPDEFLKLQTEDFVKANRLLLRKIIQSVTVYEENFVISFKSVSYTHLTLPTICSV